MAAWHVDLNDGNVRSAIAMSRFSDLPPDALRELTADARMVRIRAGSMTHRAGDTQPHFELVVQGLIRAFVTAPDGRTMTIRYCRPGAVLGAVSLFADSFSLPGTVQALLDSSLLAMNPQTVRRFADRDVRVARALLHELSERVVAFITEIPSGAFATVRQRVARHLLDLASEQQRDTALVARVTQQELADAVGTVREVVVRILREMRSAGIVETRRDGIVILAPERLLAQTYGEERPASSGR